MSEGAKGVHRGRPYVRRKVLWITPSETKRRTGNPEFYDIVLSCGHYQMRSHTVGVWVEWRFLSSGEDLKAHGITKPPTFERSCFDCGREKPLGAYERLVIGRIPHVAFVARPELEALWEKVKDIPLPERREATT